jgi:hypothetical protein
MLKHLIALPFLSIFIFVPTVYAHPGRTDANGGHTCRTNCASWGLATGEYHTHGGGSSTGSTGGSYTAPVQEVVEPVRQVIMIPTNTSTPIYIPTKIPTKIPTRIPTKTPIPTPTSKLSATPTNAPTPTIKPAITGIKTQPKQVKAMHQDQGIFTWLFNIFK